MSDQVEPKDFYVPLVDSNLSQNPIYVCISSIGNPTLIALLAVEIKHRVGLPSKMYEVKFDDGTEIAFNCMEVLPNEIRFYINRFKRAGDLVDYGKCIDKRIVATNTVTCHVDRSYCYIFRSRNSSTYKKFSRQQEASFSRRSEFIKELQEAITHERTNTN